MGNYYSGMMNATGGSELRHHGIIGQKWGVRRFQNKDGTWTDVGKKRRRSAYETSDAGYSDQQKKGFFEKRRDKRVENYFNRIHDTEKLEKYQQLDKKGKKQVFNAVRDLEGPHGFKGKREMRNLNRIGPVNQHIGRKMRDNRLNRGAKAMEEAFSDEEVRYTGQPKKVSNSASDQIKKDIKAYQQKIRNKLPQIVNDDSNSEVSKVLKDYKQYVSSDRKRLVANYKKQYHQEPNKDGLRDFVGEMIYKKKYGDRYAKAILKDMGYDTSPESVAWLKQQPWFYSGEVEDIITY